MLSMAPLMSFPGLPFAGRAPSAKALSIGNASVQDTHTRQGGQVDGGGGVPALTEGLSLQRSAGYAGPSSITADDTHSWPTLGGPPGIPISELSSFLRKECALQTRHGQALSGRPSVILTASHRGLPSFPLNDDFSHSDWT